MLREFTHLHIHTEYSIQDGAIDIKDLVKKAKQDGQTAVAITDHGNMFGTTKFYKACKDEGIKPIIGCEVYTESRDGTKSANHMVLLAKSIVGYKNLSKLVSYAYDNFYRKPQVTWDNLRKYSEGIICLSGCLGGEVARNITKGDNKELSLVVLELKNIFKEDFYLEIQRHSLKEDVLVNLKVLELGEKYGIKVVATADSHFLNAEDWITQDILLCLQTGKTISEPGRMKFDGEGHHFQTIEEMNKRFSDIPNVLENTKEIENKVNLELELNSVSMPHFDIPEGFNTEAEYFRYLTKQGFDFRFKNKPEYLNPVYKERLDYEIEIIEKMGFEGYFLIVQDFIMYAKDNGIMVGPGRGSCVGSLVSYCLQITDLDPIPLNLLFERFLNPERVSNPDMDIDFEYERRDEVIDYVIKKYGTEAVCGIITFGTFGAKGVVRDVARVLELPYSLGDKIAKTIPNELGITLEKALEISPELKSMYTNDPDVKKVIDSSLPLEGFVRHTSTHACGKVIAPQAVVNFMPEAQIEDKKTKEKIRVSQMTDVEEMGLLKFDFLGLRTMGVIGNSLKLVNEKRLMNGEKEIKYLDIPLTDWEVFQYISKGDTFGVFQLESGGMRQLMKEMFADVDTRAKQIKKNNVKDELDKQLHSFGFELFERLVAAVSLYRPGPLDYIPQYINGMKRPHLIKYDCPELEEILSPTYGTIVYQEQVQMIVRKLAGYSLGRGDLIRRAMGKKKADVMEEEKKYFIYGKTDKDGNIEVTGCIRNGISEEVASKVWEQMADFAKYAFNKSHAAAYAMIAYITAWIKYYYPLEFMTAMLNSYISDAKKLKLYLSVVQKMGINIFPPDVNKSKDYFSIEDNNIRFGLKGLRNMGNTSLLILNEKNERGEFETFQELAERMAKYQKINKKDMESIIFSGAGDCFEGTRRAKLHALPHILLAASNEKKSHQNGQFSIFDISSDFNQYKEIKTPDMNEFDKKYKLEKEKEFAGFYVTEHPLDDYEKYFSGEGVQEIGVFIQDELDDAGEVIENNDYQWDGNKVKIAGIIKDLKLYYTKRDNKPLYVFTLEDRTGEMGCVIFSDKIELNQSKLHEDKIVLIDGIIKHDDRGVQLIVSNVVDIEEIAKSQTPKYVVINAIEKKQFDMLDSIIKSNIGTVPVYLSYKNKKYRANNDININLATYTKLQKVFGTEFKVINH